MDDKTIFHVYILKSQSTGRLYTGHTACLKTRIEHHNLGNSPYTKSRGPWSLVYSEEFGTRSEAMRREKFLKSGKGRQLLAKIITNDK